MKVFISWSGENSKKLAEAMRSWLPAVLQLVNPYFTPSDIEKGTRWNTEIGKELELSEVGILCITRDNIHSDWVMFEAGALSKSIDKSYVCPILFDIHNTDLAGPLKQFQTTEFEKEDFRKLVSVINSRLGENKLNLKTLEIVFEKWWPELETKVTKILSDIGEGNAEPIRSERELLEEILELTRMNSRRSPLGVKHLNPGALRLLVQEYIELHNENQAGHGSYQDTLDHLANMKKAIKYLVNYSISTPELKVLVEQIELLSFKHEKEEDAPESDDIPF